jgi:hypothetical protein
VADALHVLRTELVGLHCSGVKPRQRQNEEVTVVEKDVEAKKGEPWQCRETAAARRARWPGAAAGPAGSAAGVGGCRAMAGRCGAWPVHGESAGPEAGDAAGWAVSMTRLRLVALGGRCETVVVRQCGQRAVYHEAPKPVAGTTRLPSAPARWL